MKFVAIFLVSVVLFSAADSAPSAETGKTGPVSAPVQSPSKDTHVPDSSQGSVAQASHEVKKEDIASAHASADSKQSVTSAVVPIPTLHPAVDPAAKSTPPTPAPPPPPTPAPAPPPTTPTTTTTTTTTTQKSTTTSSTTPSPPTTPTTTTTAPTTSTSTTPKPTPQPAPKSTSTAVPTAKPVPVPTTPAPKPAERHFDGPSFIGGAVLVLGLGAISGVLYMFYKARTDQNYRTL